MKTKFFMIVAAAGLGLSVGSCKKVKLEKELDGTYTRPSEIVTYSDSTTQVFHEAFTVDFDRKKGTFAWGGVVTGRSECSVEKSDRNDKDELQLIFDSPNWSSMLPAGAAPNTSVLSGSKFYLKAVGSTLYFTIVQGSSETVYVFSRQ